MSSDPEKLRFFICPSSKVMTFYKISGLWAQ